MVPMLPIGLPFDVIVGDVQYMGGVESPASLVGTRLDVETLEGVTLDDAVVAACITLWVNAASQSGSQVMQFDPETISNEWAQDRRSIN